MLQQSSSSEPLGLTERATAVFFLTLLPAGAVMVIVCLFHLGVL